MIILWSVNGTFEDVARADTARLNAFQHLVALLRGGILFFFFFLPLGIVLSDVLLFCGCGKGFDISLQCRVLDLTCVAVWLVG